MSEPEHPQIYLISPPEFELSGFSDQLGRMLDQFEIACVRLRMSTDDPDTIGRAADLLRDTCHNREVPLVIDSHYRLVETHGLDGVHLSDGTRQLRDIRKELGSDAIIGCYCGASRHNGMSAGEAGADYIAFGPVTESPLGGPVPAEFETFEWWSQVVEIPVVAEGYITLEAAETLAPVTDFFALGQEVWAANDGPEAALAEFHRQIGA
ncbi:MAG: thiamine phosphate synthase [Rhodobacteraceae bacterium]|nr:thiamine phosphate synthase [Paracoccaceae bacterium]